MRRFPKGRISADDDGETMIRIGIDHERVILRFAHPMGRIGLDAVTARNLSLLIRQKADMLDPPSACQLPEAKRDPENLAGLAFLAINELQVGSYTPLPNGEGQATEVHLVIRVGGVPDPLLMRFHSPATLDSIIAALQRHRNDVWPSPTAKED